MENEILPILQKIRTYAERRRILEAFDSIIAGAFHTGAALETSINQSLPYEIAHLILNLLKKQGISEKDPIHIQELLEKVSKEIQKIPVITLTLAVLPSGDLSRRIVAWLETSYPYPFLLEYKIDQTIIAGVIVTHEGKYRDFSFKHKFDELSEKHDLLKRLEESLPA